MPRITASKPMVRSAAAPVRNPAPVRRTPKKIVRPPDRLSNRTLFIRRMKRSLKPGLWLFGAVAVVSIGAAAFRHIPADVAPVMSPAGSMRHGVASVIGAFGFRIRNIQINGAETTPLPLIQAALGVQTGDPIFGLSLTALQSRLEQLGPVQTATVERALPGTLIINITERNAYAVWQSNGVDGEPKFVLIDKQGNVIANQDAVAAKRREPSLLLLAGADAPANAQTLITELASAPELKARVVAAQRIDGLRWNLILKDEALVKLPADGEQDAIAQLESLQASMGLLDRPVEVIDLRLAGRMVVRPYPTPLPPPPAPDPGKHK